MNDFKSPFAAEFCQVMDALRRRGIRPAEVARRMSLSKPTISNYLSGTVDVPESRVKHLRQIVEGLDVPVRYPDAPPEGVAGSDHPDVMSDAAKLDDIRRADPQAFQTVREVIGTYHRSTRSSSAAIERAAAGAPGALKLALHPDPARPPAHKAGEPISYKRRPKRGTGTRSGTRPESPTQAPK